MSAPDIFYVEDDTDFAFLTKHAMEEVNNGLTVSIIDNGKEALENLQLLSEHKIKPRLIMLDLNLPGMSGHDLLKKIKEMPGMKYVPVVFFTTSDNPKDIRASLEFGANAYLTKPSGYLNLVSCLSSLHDFWFTKHIHLN